MWTAGIEGENARTLDLDRDSQIAVATKDRELLSSPRAPDRKTRAWRCGMAGWRGTSADRRPRGRRPAVLYGVVGALAAARLRAFASTAGSQATAAVTAATAATTATITAVAGRRRVGGR